MFRILQFLSFLELRIQCLHQSLPASRYSSPFYREPINVGGHITGDCEGENK